MAAKPLKKRVLIAEDESVVRKLCFRVLSRGPYLLDQAGTLKDAFASIKAAAPDLLVTDLNFPDGEGDLLIDRFQNAYPQAKVIVMTGSFGKELELSALFPGVEIFTKPFEPKDLLRAVRNAFGEKDSEEAEVSSPAELPLVLSKPEDQLA